MSAIKPRRSVVLLMHGVYSLNVAAASGLIQRLIAVAMFGRKAAVLKLLVIRRVFAQYSEHLAGAVVHA